MKHATCFSLVVSAAVLCGPFLEAQAQQPPPRSYQFFVTGAGPGKGGDLGTSAASKNDRHSQELAQRAGAAPGVPI